MGNDRESQEVGFYVSVFGIQGSVGIDIKEGITVSGLYQLSAGAAGAAELSLKFRNF
jgi:hypothetical protein